MTDPGGRCAQDGRLQSGDHILQIGEHNLRGMESVQVGTAGKERGAGQRVWFNVGWMTHVYSWLVRVGIV